MCIILAPQWAKGYFRAGIVFFKLDMLIDAMDMVRETPLDR